MPPTGSLHCTPSRPHGPSLTRVVRILGHRVWSVTVLLYYTAIISHHSSLKPAPAKSSCPSAANYGLSYPNDMQGCNNLFLYLEQRPRQKSEKGKFLEGSYLGVSVFYILCIGRSLWIENISFDWDILIIILT